MHVLSKTVHQFVQALPSVKRVVVAFSGGVDSTVLLHATVHAELRQPVSAIHINHQLSDSAEDWEAHCAQICTDMKVPCVCLKVNVDASSGGVEQGAREARIGAMSAQLRDGDLLLMGHHQQDQVETFFLRLVRGSGLRGLSSMSGVRALGAAQLGRPLLSVNKDMISQYASGYELSWVEDESNVFCKFDRNFLRLHIIPSLQSRWPAFANQVSKATALLTETELLLNEYASLDLVQLKPRVERVGHSIKIGKIADWSEARRNAVIRQWLHSLNYRSPSQKQLKEITPLMEAEIDKKPLLNWVDCEMRRYKGRLYCLPSGWENKPDGKYQNYQLGTPLIIGESRVVPRGGTITLMSAETGLKLGVEYHVVLRNQLDGALRSRPYDRSNSQKVKKLLQEYKLEPWLRERVPFIMAGDKIAAVSDLWVEADYYAEASGVSVKWSIELEA